jgi:L-fuculose-phosphate aldolase
LGFVAATDGNVSARLNSRTILITRGGLPKGEAKSSDVVSVRLTGAPRGRDGRASSELPMHLALYRASPRIGAVVHAHPPYATAFAVSGRRLTPNVFPEVLLEFGNIPLVRYAMPSSEELGTMVARYADTCAAALLANHGAVAWGRTVSEALRRMEKLEHAARVEFYASILGGVNRLTPEQVSDLRSNHPHVVRTA